MGIYRLILFSVPFSVVFLTSMTIHRGIGIERIEGSHEFCDSCWRINRYFENQIIIAATQHVDVTKQIIKRQFHQVIALEQTDAKTISNAILQYFDKNLIDGRKMVMFTSDGANVRLLGWQNGTAVRIKRALDCSHIISFHCVVHLQALGVKDTCKMAKHASFMRLEHMLNDLIAFLNTHKHRVEFNSLASLLETEYTNLEPVFFCTSPFAPCKKVRKSLSMDKIFLILKENDENVYC